MADQEFLASYAVDVDEEGVARLQSVLEGNRELAASLGAAFRAAYGELENFVRGAAGAVPGLSGFVVGQNEAAAAAGRAAGAIRELGEAYEGLRGLIPEGTLEISVAGMRPLAVENGSGAAGALEITLPEMKPLSVENGIGAAGALEITLPEMRPLAAENGNGSAGVDAWLADISGAVNRLVSLSGGSDSGTENGKGAGSSTSGALSVGESVVSLDLAGASEELTGFLEELAASEAEIRTGLDLTGAEEGLSGFLNETAGMEGVMPLRLDRTKAEATLADLKRVMERPVSLSADASRVLSAAGSALNTIRQSFAGTTLELNAVVKVSGGGSGGSGGGEDDGSGAGSETGGAGTGTGSGSGQDDGPLVTALRSATGGKYSRPTKVEVAEDGDTEYIIPVDKEPTAVPLLRQAIGELSQEAREAVVGNREMVEVEKQGGFLGNREIDVPEIVVPEIAMTDVQIPEIKLPEIDVPDIVTPDLAAPEINVPEITIPELQVPEIEVPEIDVPEIVAPDLQVPEIDVPDLTIPEIRVPEIEVPEIVAPDLQVPEINAPDLTLPEMQVSEIEMPEFDNLDDNLSEEFESPWLEGLDDIFPEMKVPGINLPELNVPENYVPEIDIPDISLTEIPMPELDLPKMPDDGRDEIDEAIEDPFQHLIEPEIVISDLEMPGVEMPEVEVPEMRMPDIDVPEVGLPEIVMPDVEAPEMGRLDGALERLNWLSEEAVRALQGIPEMVALAAGMGVPGNVTSNETKSVEAPVSINVTANGTDAELLAQSIYQAAERHLVRTLRGVM